MAERKVTLEKVSEGSQLTRVVSSPDGTMLLEKGHLLTSEDIELLTLYRIPGVYVEEGTLGLSLERQKRLETLFEGLEGNPLMAALKESARQFLIKHSR